MALLLKCYIVIMMFYLTQETPTIVEDRDYDPYEDAFDIYTALHAKHADQDTLREILVDRVCSQRLEIKRAYWYLYNYDIRESIAKNTDGTYEQLLKDLFWCGDDLNADMIIRYLKGSSITDNGHTKSKNILEVMVTATQSADTRNRLKNAYERLRFDTDFVNELAGKLSGDFKNIMREMAVRTRRPKEPINHDDAYNVAVSLHEERKKWENHREVLDSTLIETPFEQLMVVLEEFKKVSDGMDLMEVVSEKMSGTKENAYQDLIHFVKTYSNNHIEYFATRLKEATEGPGTDEQTLIRIILGHSETDMKEIEDQFRTSYNRELSEKIARDTSGGFEYMLKQFLTKTPQQIEEIKKKREERRKMQKARKKARGGALPESTRPR